MNSTKTIIPLSNYMSGMKIAETIYNEYGATIVGEGTTLDEFTISKLQLLNIQRIKIYTEPIQEMKRKNEFVSRYDNQRNEMKDVIKDISTGQNVPVDKIHSIVDSFVYDQKSSKDILSCINQVKEIDESTYTHSIDVSLLSMMIGKWLDYKEEDLHELTQAGLLHDIGKSQINPALLNKRGELTEEEKDQMKKHVSLSYKLIHGVTGISGDVVLGVLMHHERENGSGYILGKTSNEIHKYAKIIAVADIYDNLISGAATNINECPFEVFEKLQNAMFRELDAKVTMTFLKNISSYFIGDKFRLDDGRIAEIIQINSTKISKPLIKVDDEYIDLAKYEDIKLVGLPLF